MTKHELVKDKADDIKAAIRHIYREIEWMDENTDFGRIDRMADMIIEAAGEIKELKVDCPNAACCHGYVLIHKGRLPIQDVLAKCPICNGTGAAE